MRSVLLSKNLKLIGAAGLILLSGFAYAGEHEHKHAEGKPAASLNQGKKWETDQALRQSMENIRQLMTNSQADIEREKLKPADYHQLADTIEKNISYIVKNCKLSKEADNAFHTIVLADLMQNTEMMRKAPKIQMRRVGALGVLQSLRHYGEYFQHPGWQINMTNPA